MRATKTKGFTLTELIIVIVIMGILSTVVTPLIANKFSAVHQSTQRAHWVQQAEYALFQIRQDLANSVPNSIFVDPLNADLVVEFLGAPPNAALYVARYRDQPNSTVNDRLQPNDDDIFDIFGAFDSPHPTYVSIGTSDAGDMRDDWGNLLAAGTTGTLAQIDLMEPVVLDTSVTPAILLAPAETRITLPAKQKFGLGSPFFRAYFTNGPIAYECDMTKQLLYRVKAYVSLNPVFGFANRTDTSTPANRARVIDSLIACSFELTPGSTYQPPALRVSLEIGDSSETIQLVDTIVLSNGS
ncbi:type II secretion system protein [Reinekea sp.]|jgi:prepilin-type N-terminal cleavage/methylation domain-containing protein|uniref:type II secretion system protein n=1 Tax=Reinekea sp. TaxID=1970455 RepID=UPI002A82B239|nr:type II secretion system protein [Reinekea sp.]